MDQVDGVLTRAVEEILPNKEGLKKLMSSKKIRLYLGVDPTGSKLHLGHTIPLRKLNEFAKAGHEAILVVGTGTVLAGDPSQRLKARERITQKEIKENIKTWKSQAGKIVDLKKVQIKYNGDWLLKLSLAEILNIASYISSVQLFKREMFQRRIDAGDTVFTDETLYPLLQGYDSVALDVDLEIGGTDQTFNMLIGRELQKKMKNREKYVLTTPLINGADGKPMSKSSGNCIWLDDTAEDMFGKIMALADSEIQSYWENLTDLSKSDLKNLKPLDAKKTLAFEIVKTYHGQEEADKAQSEFENVFQKGSTPQDIPEITIDSSSIDIVDFLASNNLVESRSQAKRLLDQKALELDGQTIENNEVAISGNEVLKIGKKKFVKIRISR